MFIIIYKKSTNHVVSYRNDGSTNAQTAEYWFSVYLKDNNISATDALDLAYAETDYVELMFDTNKYKWNPATQQVDLDPDYVPPTPASEPEPTPTV